MAEQEPERNWQVYVWQAPVRVTHWVHVAAMVVLAFSGYYIGSPFLVAPADPATSYIMGGMRLAHAVGAIFLGLSFVVRVYWSLVGNRYSRVAALLPVTAEARRNFGRQAAYYLFLSSRRMEYAGHPPIAGVTYFIMYVLVFLQGFTGLALYSEYFPGGFWSTFFGWAFRWIASDNVLRLFHHSLLWVFIIFFLVHLYLAVINDLAERTGVTSSIVTGYKLKQPHAVDMGEAKNP